MIDRRFLALLSLVSVSACSGGGGSTPSSGNTATLSVALVDAPFAMSGDTVTAVNLGIDKVEAVGAGAPAIVASYATPNVVNVLSYTSATTALSFPTATIPAGSYRQIRFVLDSATTTISYTDSSGAPRTAPLTVPSGTVGGFGNASSTDSGDGAGTSGFKVNVALDASAGSTYAFILDFNAAQSIVLANSNFILKPVIAATAVATSGAISGTVQNAAGTTPVVGAEVDAQQGGVTINSGVTDANGAFAVNALPAGTYTLVVKNSGTTLAGATFNATGADATVGVTVTDPSSVTVTAGTTANAGIIKD